MHLAKCSSIILLSALLALAAPAAAQLTFQPASADFGQVQVDTLRTITVELTSGVVQDVTLSPLNAPFSVTPTVLSFGAVDETKAFTITFLPFGIGSFSQTISATGSIWGTSSVPVTGQGVAVALATATDSLDFGTVSINQPETLDVLVTNTGVGDLIISGGSSSDEQFTVPSTIYTVLEGQSVTIPISFTPAFAGPQSAFVSFESNAPADPLISVACNGIGVSNISGDVSGVWTAGNSPYRIVGNVTVIAGTTLTIEPGTEVEFMVGTSMLVNGTLRATGTATQRIVFGSPYGTGSIKTGQVGAVLDFDYCDFDTIGNNRFEDGFESGALSDLWTGDGEVSTSNPLTGSWCLTVYAQGADAEAILGPFTATGTATLSYNWRVDRSESYCYFRVYYRRNGGTWSQLYSYSSTIGWNLQSHSISASPGDIIEFRFLADTDNRNTSYDEEEFFIDNVSYALSGDKRVIDMTGGTLSMANSTLTGAAGYGVWTNSAESVSIFGSTFSDCVWHPIRLQAVSGEVTIRQSIIRHNDKGMYISTPSAVTIDQCTVYDNQEYGVTLTSWPFVTISNSIFWLNKAGAQYTQIYNASAYLDVTYSDIQGLGSYGITGSNFTVGPNCIGADPQFADQDGRLSENSPSIDAATPWLHDAHMPPGLGTIVADMGAFGGPGNHVWGGNAVPDGVPQIQSIVDIPQDNGGFVGIQYDRSLFDGQHLAYDITRYSFWRAMNLAANRGLGVENLTASWYPTGPVFQTAANQYWEHVGDMIAQQFTNYAYTAPTYADSVAGNPFDIEFLVIAHTPDNDIFFTSTPDSGHSVDNLAPPAPQELQALPTLNGVYLSWTPSLANDVARYLIYRSLDQNQSIAGREPVAISVDTVFLDESVGELVDYFYVVAAEDVHGNVSPPSPWASGLVPVAIYLEEYDVELIAGVPTLSWSVNATEPPRFMIVRGDDSGAREELDSSMIQTTESRYTFRDLSTSPGHSYGYTVQVFTPGDWMTLFTTDQVITPKLAFGLRQVAPNPFNPATTIAFATTEPGRAAVNIYDVKGRRVRTLFDENVQPGLVELTWHGDDQNGTRVGSGVYLVVLTSNEGAQAQKVMLMK